MQYTWKIGGEAGFGIMTTGLLFAKIAARSGYHIYDFVEYPSLIRGGHNAYDVTFGDEQVTTLKPLIDLLVCLNKETFDLHKNQMNRGGIILYDPDQFTPEIEANAIAIPFSKILKNLNGQVIMKNMVALGASLALLGADISELVAILGEQFGKKGESIISLNRSFAEKGYEEIQKSYSKYIYPHLQGKKTQKQMVITGNEAFAYGAVVADCRFYAAYPMTPSSGVLTALAGWSNKTGMVVRHAEDEIAVINSALGASFAGVRSAVGSSGGGFALMVEAISMAGITELPVVVFVSQRPGPATGMPTWTEQGDLLFSVHAGHGEFQKIVLAPGDHQEMIEMTLKAFDLADIYQLPVIVLSDMLLSESHASVSFDEVKQLVAEYKPKRGKLIKTADATYKRYAITNDGISPRLIPGQKGIFYQANSYEHLEDGHTSESAEERIKQVEKRAHKWDTYLENDFVLPQLYGNLNTAQTVFVGWGSTKGVALETIKQAKLSGKDIAYIHFSSLYPLHEKKITELFSNIIGKCILVENNATAQLGKLLRMETGVSITKKIVRFDGRPLAVEQLLNFKTEK
ncbi:MAG: 2-oxoacid:acceptor oxidoreductase subunit alpha [bacterium]